MRGFFSLPFKNNNIGRSVRVAIVAAMLIYVLMMIIVMPNMEAYADSSENDNIAAISQETQNET